MRILVSVLVLLIASAQCQQINPDTIFQRAIAEQQQGNYASAIRDYRTYLAQRPNTVEAEVNLGAALAHTGQFDEAIKLYRAALPSLTYKNPVLLDIGLAYFKKGDFSNADEQFTALHKLQPDDVRVAILLGDTDIKLNKPQDAVILLEPFDGKEPKNMDFEYVLGLALVKSGHLRDGVAHIEKVANSTHSADSYQLAGESLLRLNEFERARHDLEAALQLNPKLPNIYTMVGEARDKTGATAQAKAAFLKALEINPDDFEANLYVGGILYKGGDLGDAKLYLDKALKLKPADPMARYESAMLESASGQYETAALALEQLAGDDPEWLEPHVELASLYYKLHRPKDGAKERAIVDRIMAEQQARGPIK